VKVSKNSKESIYGQAILGKAKKLTILKIPILEREI
jgi:hypothetical protein